MFERLEARRLFTASAVLDGTVLRITGTDAAETIFVTQDSDGFHVGQNDGNFINLNPPGFENGVPECKVTRVVLDGAGGNDVLTFQGSGAVGADVNGGEGNDEIHLDDQGTGVSIGHGGNGDDLLIIFKGNGTSAYGDNGCDRLMSWETVNHTYLYGGNAKDDMSGNDQVIMEGGNGKDSVNGLPE